MDKDTMIGIAFIVVLSIFWVWIWRETKDIPPELEV